MSIEHEKPSINNDYTTENITIADKKKKAGRFSFFKAVIYKLRGNWKNKKSEKQLPPPPQKWQKIVGSMRPLTLQDEDGSSMRKCNERMRSSPSTGSFEDATVPPYSPSCTTSRYASAVNLYVMDDHPMSRYASTNNLCAMDEEEDNDCVFDIKPADDMIDEKAERFIAHFYAQLRSQH